MNLKWVILNYLRMRQGDDGSRTYMDTKIFFFFFSYFLSSICLSLAWVSPLRLCQLRVTRVTKAVGDPAPKAPVTLPSWLWEIAVWPGETEAIHPLPPTTPTHTPAHTNLFPLKPRRQPWWPLNCLQGYFFLWFWSIPHSGSWITLWSGLVESKKPDSLPSFHPVSVFFSSNWQCFCWGAWLRQWLILILISLSNGCLATPLVALFWIHFLIFCNMGRLRIFQILKSWFFLA